VPAHRHREAMPGVALPDVTATRQRDTSRGEGHATSPRIEPQEAAHACRSLIGADPTRIEYPGGASRCSVRAVAGERSVIVTRRKHSTRAELEAGVLRELRAAGAPVPEVLAYDGEWLIQQDLGQQRLSAALQTANLQSAADTVAQAAAALLLCQRAAQQVGLAQRVAPIGVSREWLASLLSIPARLARQLDLPDPGFADAVAPEQIRPLQLSFVKWDARPGNAMQVEQGADDLGIRWIDWEHCGARDALDDLVWLLCDEYMPDHVGLETALLERFVPLFALMSGRSPDGALLYLSRFGVLHTCMRLHLVLSHKGDGAWWSPEACMRTDRIGVTAHAARRLCSRGARWARRLPGGGRMNQFFAEADQRLRAMSVDAPQTFASPQLAPSKTPAAVSAPL
jgi:hypothetical protein